MRTSPEAIPIQTLIQNLPEGITMLDKDGYIRYANDTASVLTGFSQDELIKKPVYQLYEGQNDSIKSEYELSLALKKGKFLSEGWRVRKDGTRYWGEFYYAAIYDTHRLHAGFSCVIRDITEKKLAELDLRNSEERFRLMVEGVKEYSIFLMSPTGHILTWNEGAHRITGYSPMEIVNKHFSIFYTAEDIETGNPEREIRIATETGKYEEEAWRVKKNGSLFWANVVLTALYNEQNKLIGFSKVTRDLTEKKESEETLRQSEERYRSLVEQVTDYGIFLLDEKGRIVSWNEGARRIKGYTEEEIVGKYFSIFYPEEDIIIGKPAHELKVARAEGKYEEEGWRLRKDGSRFWANVVITAVFSNDGTHLGYSKVTRDLTERKQAEKELRDSYEKYRHLADELKTTNNELFAANKELEQFTSIVSHDLQEPVRTIKSFLQLIDMKLEDRQYDQLKVYISKAIGGANRMKELIQNLLHYSQLGKQNPVNELISVDEIINEALQNLKGSVDASQAEIIVENDVETITGDRVQLVQLIQNLLSNALKFTDTSKPEVKIRCRRENGLVKFSVSDNGIGIPEDEQCKVFEIFKRLNTEKEYPGTGIGLAICKKIVDRHDGKIWPESRLGKGTTFHFTLNEPAEAKTL